MAVVLFVITVVVVVGLFVLGLFDNDFKKDL